MLDDLTPRKAVEFAIKTEELGQKIYQRLAKRLADDGEIREVFEVLARDEGLHRHRFAQLLEQTAPGVAQSGVERWQYLRAMSISEFFRGEESLTENIDRINSREDALQRALAMEKATLQYYQAMDEALDGSSVIQSIIAEEKRHVLSIMRYLITGARVRGVPETVSDDDLRV